MLIYFGTILALLRFKHRLQVQVKIQILSPDLNYPWKGFLPKTKKFEVENELKRLKSIRMGTTESGAGRKAKTRETVTAPPIQNG
jgi:hypothetical protein